MKADHIKTTATTEAVSSHREKEGIGTKNGVEAPPAPGKKPMASRKNDLQTDGAGRK
jgi:hypothetical protein